jgi:hypothetical protein
MRTLIKLLTLAAALGAATASAAIPTEMPLPEAITSKASSDEGPWYSAGSQYTASLDRTSGHWRLQPTAGQDIEIKTGLCPTGTTVPAGLWLLVRDASGRPELLAPSNTVLPTGRPDRLPLRACDQAGDSQLAVPQTLLDLLAQNTGAILVHDGNTDE